MSDPLVPTMFPASIEFVTQVHEAIKAVTLKHPVFGCMSLRWRYQQDAKHSHATGDALDARMRTELRRELDRGGIALVVVTEVPDRSAPVHVPLIVEFMCTMAKDGLYTFARVDFVALRSFVARFVRDQLMIVALHEIDEMIEVEGVRVFDPHRDDPVRR